MVLIEMAIMDSHLQMSEVPTIHGLFFAISQFGNFNWIVKTPVPMDNALLTNSN